MSTNPNSEGGPAFPVNIPGCGDNGWSGMTLRDWFAGQALAGILAGPCSKPGVPMHEWMESPREAYRLADLMLAERNRDNT